MEKYIISTIRRTLAKRENYWSEAVNRRTLLTSALFAVGAGRLPFPAWIGPAQAQEKVWRHGVSLFGDLKYPAGFKQFDYVNAAAPKGGSVREVAIGTYDSFNIVVAGVKGAPAIGVDLIYETLLTPAFDEVSSEYGLLAEAVCYAEDFSWASYRMRAEAKWHDGKPVTPEDAIFSFHAFRKHSPQQAAYYRHVAKIEKTGDREITFTFDAPGNRELPQIVGQLQVLPQHWWEGTDKNGNKRDIGATTLEPPLGSGAYRIKEFSPGRNIVYERVKDYWGAAQRQCRSRQFRRTRLRIFPRHDGRTGGIPGNKVDWRTENSAKNWATAYDFPAVKEGRVILEEFPISNRGVMQAFAFNIRRAKFQDPRVRLAFNYAFDFEQMNKEIFFGQYTRIASYFQGTEWRRAVCPADGNWKFWKRYATKSPPRFSRRPIPIRLAAIRRLCEATCARRCGCSRKPATRCVMAACQRQDRRAVCGRISHLRSQLRACVLVLQTFARPAWRDGDGAQRRRRAIHQPAARLGFRRGHECLGRIAFTGQ